MNRLFHFPRRYVVTGFFDDCLAAVTMALVIVLLLFPLVVVAADSDDTQVNIDSGESKTNTEGVMSVGMFEFVDMALDRSSDMKKIRLDLMIAEARHRQAIADILPSVSFDMTAPSINSSTDRIQRIFGEGYQEWTRKSGNLGSSFNLNQKIPTGGSIGISSNISKMQIEENPPGAPLTVSQNFSSDIVFNFDQPLFGVNTFRDNLYQASVSERKAELTFSASKADLVNTLVADFVNHMKNVRRLSYLKASLERNAGIVESAERQFNEGVLSELDFLQAKLDYSNARVAVIEAEENVMKSRRTLLREMGVDKDFRDVNIVFADSSGRETLIHNEDEYRDLALKKRADYLSLQLDRELELHNLKSIRKSRGISTDVKASVGWKGAGEFISDGMDNFGFNLWSVNLTLSIPIWDGGLAAAKLREAEYQVDAASLSLDETRYDILEDVDECLFDVRNAGKKLDILEESLDVAKKNYNIAKGMFDNGVYGLDDLMEAMVRLEEAEVDASDALADYNLAVYALRKAVGLDIFSGK